MILSSFHIQADKAGSPKTRLLCHPFMKSFLHGGALVHFYCWRWQEIMWFPAKTSKPTLTARVKIRPDNTLLHNSQLKTNTAVEHMVACSLAPCSQKWQETLSALSCKLWLQNIVRPRQAFHIISHYSVCKDEISDWSEASFERLNQYIH